MKTSCFSITSDGSNDQGPEKMNSVTVRIFNIKSAQSSHQVSMQKPFSELLMPLCQNMLFCGIHMSH